MSILAVAGLAVGLFAVPLAFAAGRLYRDEAAARLAREASRAAGAVSDEVLAGRAPLRLPPPLDRHTRLGLYDGTGALIAGLGPRRAGIALAVVRDGGEHETLAGDELAVAVPIRVGRRDAAVRAAAPYDDVLARTYRAWALMAGLALAVVGVAALLARRQASRIAAPLEELTGAARALGTGDFTVRPRPSGLREADEAGAALQATAARLGGLLERERSFSADASHQIRTPLTALRLGVEAALVTPGADLRAALRSALEQVDRVEATVEELLAFARDTLTPAAALDVPALLRRAADDRWRPIAAGTGRRVALRVEPGLPPARASMAVVQQVLDVLVTNALRHGDGTVTVSARRAPSGVAVEVTDEGPGFDAVAARTAFVRRSPHARGHGIGLALARDLAEADGGRLVLSRAGPAPVLALLLPEWTG